MGKNKTTTKKLSCRFNLSREYTSKLIRKLMLKGIINKEDIIKVGIKNYYSKKAIKEFEKYINPSGNGFIFTKRDLANILNCEYSYIINLIGRLTKEGIIKNSEFITGKGRYKYYKKTVVNKIKEYRSTRAYSQYIRRCKHNYQENNKKNKIQKRLNLKLDLNPKFVELLRM